MQDVKISNLEIFFDCFDESNNFLYEKFHKRYFELIEMTANNILASEVLTEFDDPNDEKELQKIYDKLKGVEFSCEDVRKAMQSIILRGFKQERIPNGMTTPDTLGIFISYLITKITKEKELSILDPLCGVGNLLLTVSNHLDKDLKLFACDHDLWMAKLTKITADLLSTDVEILLQDTLSLALSNMDFIIYDIPHTEYEKDKPYFPYESMLKYKDMLKDGGSIIAILENDFFSYDSNQEFKKELLKDTSILGLVELPDEMFKATKPKIIVVLQKIKVEDKCFMVKLPSFTDVSAFNESLIEIEAWFEKYNKNKEKSIKEN